MVRKLWLALFDSASLTKSRTERAVGDLLGSETLIVNSSSCMLLLSVRLVRKQAHASWNQWTRKVTLPDCHSPGRVSQDSVRLRGWQGFGYHQFNLELTG